MPVSDVYVVGTYGADRSTLDLLTDEVEVEFGHRAVGAPTLTAVLRTSGVLVDADTLEEFAPALELDLQRALASYVVDFGVLGFDGNV